MNDNLKQWIKAACVRAIKTFFQSLAVALPVGASIDEMGWLPALGIAAGAAVLSLITSLAGLPELENGASIATLAKQPKE